MKESDVTRLTELMEKRVSFWHNFLMGIVNGVGSVIGATLIGGVVVGLILSNIDKLEEIPFLDELINPSEVEELLEVKNV